ncbi:hypothetical protein [Rhizobium sp. BK376]|uniref:hypothetical protein n=1 Tax=Rhizobium sp. BK376 TaxID=2512149 RepID=UPI00104DE05A|nr:hypothetical protein [Rhizobium sp. BK376]
MVAKSGEDALPDDAVVDVRDAGFYLRIDPQQVSALVTSGLFPSGGLKICDIREFRSKYMPLSEIVRWRRLHDFPTLHFAAIYRAMVKAGIRLLHSQVAIYERCEVNEYLTKAVLNGK